MSDTEDRVRWDREWHNLKREREAERRVGQQ